MLLCALLLASAVDAPGGETELMRGAALLAQMEIEPAAAALESAARGGPYARPEVIALLRDLGIARAYLGDAEGARTAFAELLLVDPGHALSYTVSPRATFLFEEARGRLKEVRAAALRLEAPAVVAPGETLAAALVVDADPFPVTTLDLAVRPKGGAELWRRTQPRPALKVPVEVQLGAAPAEGTLLVEVLVSGRDARGWELFAETRELAIPVVAPTPWYAQWWVWALVGSTAAAGTGAAVAVALWPTPTTVPGRFEVLR